MLSSFTLKNHINITPEFTIAVKYVGYKLAVASVRTSKLSQIVCTGYPRGAKFMNAIKYRGYELKITSVRTS